MAWEKLIRSGSNAHLNQVTASFFRGDGSALTGVASSSYAVSASYAPGGFTGAGPDTSIQFRDGSAVTGSSNLLFDKTINVLRLSGATSINAITASGNINNYLQINLQNLNASSTASTDIVATNNTGTEIGNYIDMGINSSTYSVSSLLGGANDAYLYSTGSKLIIGNVTPSVHPSSSIYFVVGGLEQSTHTKMIISSSGVVSASAFAGNGSQLTNISSASFSVTSSYFQEIKSVGLTIDGGGSIITTGIKADITFPYSGYINAWYLTSDVAGDIVIDVWKDTFANFPPTVADTITGTELPTLSGTAFNSDTNLTTWSKQVTTGDVIRFNVVSAATIKRVNLVIKILT